MDSSKRHWPSMFKSKSSVSSQGHQSQHDTSSLISTPTSTVSSGTVEKAPEPKPRWNPKPEQIRILEGIFNSGMVTPPRDEIRRIRAQLEEYGEIGDANVFYWFQNKKSRSKNKKTSNFLNSTTKSRKRTVSKPNTSQLSYTSSSSSDKSLQKSSPGEFMPEPYSFHASQSTLVGGAIAGNAAVGTPLIRGLCSPQVISSNVDYVAQYNNSRHNLSECHGQTYGKCSAASVVVADLINHEAPNNYHKRGEDNDQMKMQRQLSYNSVTTTPTPISAQTILPPTVVSNINHIQAEGIRKCTVFINDVAFEVASGPFDVRGAFGEDAVLLHSSGQPVVTNQCGVTLHSLQHGAFYYLFRMRTPSSTSQTHGSGQYLSIG
nr:PREDICTED: WUSCHEL-related homeobox 9-like isoform X2 [Daucus carota subsp. sativus]